MITVLVAADKHEKNFCDALQKLLAPHFRVLCAYGGRLWIGRDYPELILCDIHSFSQIDADPLIVIYKNAPVPAVGLPGNGRTLAVVDSSEEGILEYVASTKLPAITCGLLSKDTVTLSSMDQDSAVINVQRNVCCLDGTEVEPQEVPIRFERSLGSFVQMAAASVCILCGRIAALSEVPI